jgi:hypothetical protein
MSAIGNYDLKVSVSYPGDPVPKNDTLTKTFKQLGNAFIDLTTEFLDDLETAAVQTHTTQQTGLIGLTGMILNQRLHLVRYVVLSIVALLIQVPKH